MEESCKFGNECYRKNRDHVKKFHSERIIEPTIKTRQMGNSKILNSNEGPSSLKEKEEKEKKKGGKAKISNFFKVIPVNSVDHVDQESENQESSCFEPCAKKAKLSSNDTLKANKDNSTMPKKITKEYYKVDRATELFWTHILSLKNANPRKSFSAYFSAELVGVFEQLEGSLDISEEQFLMHHRFPTDLPEMQTFLICDNGHYAIWRDDPKDENFLIVHSDGKDHFPTIELIGSKYEHMLLHLIGEKDKQLDTFLPSDLSVTSLKKSRTEVLKDRKKLKLGTPPHPLGIYVKVVNDVGYREIPESAVFMRKTLEFIGTTSSEELKKKKLAKISELFTFVQFANDECDFGMGLEFGHWLFLANYSSLEKMAMFSLRTAYELLGRDHYQEIVVASLEKRKLNRSDK